MTEETSHGGPRPPADSPVSPVTASRIANILDAENIRFRRESTPVAPNETPVDAVHTGFSNMTMTFAVHNDRLLAEAIWRGVAPAEDAAQALFYLNNFNQMNVTPTMRFLEQEEGTLSIGAYRQIPVAAGLTRNQLGFFIINTIEEFGRAFAILEQDRPDLVTWTEAGDERR